MKITDIRVDTLSIGPSFVRVETDEGLTGLSEVSWHDVALFRRQLDLTIKPNLIGADPLRPGRHWERLVQATPGDVDDVLHVVEEPTRERFDQLLLRQHRVRRNRIRLDPVPIEVDAKALLLSSLSVATYLEKPEDTVTLDVRFGALADGTGYPAQTTLDAKAKNITVVVANSGHRPLAR